VINSHGTAKFLLSRAASEYVKGVMTGEGADELFAGYPYFSRNEAESDQSKDRQSLANWWRLFGSSQLISGLLPMVRPKDVARLRSLFGCAPYLGVRSLFYGRLVRRLLNPEFRPYFSPIATLESVAKELRSVNGEAMTPTNVDPSNTTTKPLLGKPRERASSGWHWRSGYRGKRLQRENSSSSPHLQPSTKSSALSGRPICCQRQ